mmetsp:Transcript_14268/g.15811  ORF Transcript_14268/g.15811 Transcript_14268/m.15811 type:complete len:242 (-) Transcript_14268:109-834(-)
MATTRSLLSSLLVVCIGVHFIACARMTGYEKLDAIERNLKRAELVVRNSFIPKIQAMESKLQDMYDTFNDITTKETTMDDNYYTGAKNEANEREGFGGITKANGDWFVGDWKRDVRHGLGILSAGISLTKVTETYEGEWRYDRQHGLGHYSSGDDHSYWGEWVADEQDGWGIYDFPENVSYVGQWQSGEPHGIGYWENHEIKHVGEWHHGKRHGLARIYNKEQNKVIFEGLYENSEPLKKF